MTDRQRTGGERARARWSSRRGFILAAAGSAIGHGTVWQLPPDASAQGGGVFFLVYLAAIASVGGSVLLAELAIGRISQRNPIGALRLLGGRFWPWIGAAGIAAAFLTLSIYTMAAGRVIAFAAARAVFGVTGDGGGDALLEHLAANPVRPILGAGLFSAATVAIVIAGIRRGIERASMLLTPLALLLLCGLALSALSLPSAGRSLEAFFRADISQVTGTMVASAVGDALCSLSIGLGVMITYGSYRSPAPGLVGDAAAIVGLDVVAAMAAGIAVSAVLSAVGDGSASGFRLLLVTLPEGLGRLPYGSVCQAAFFGLLLAVALTSAISLLEPIVAYFIDEHGFRRRHIAIAVGVYAFLLGVPSGWSLSPETDLTLFGRPIPGAINVLTAEVLMPLGGLLTAVFVGWVLGRSTLPACFGAGNGHPWYGRMWLILLRGPVPLAILWSLVADLIL